jgi:ubiquitin conjugation factor E4 B
LHFRPPSQRHLLSDPTDPFSRRPLTEAELAPLPHLAARIKAWRKRSRGGATTGDAMTMEV